MGRCLYISFPDFNTSLLHAKTSRHKEGASNSEIQVQKSFAYLHIPAPVYHRFYADLKGMIGDLNLFKRGRGLSMVKSYQNAIENYCIISTEIEILKGYTPPSGN